MKKKIRKFEVVYLTIMLMLLVAIPAIETYQHAQPIFHEREVQDDQRKRIETNYNFIINDNDWDQYLKNLDDGSADAQEKMYSKWRRERNNRN